MTISVRNNLASLGVLRQLEKRRLNLSRLTAQLASGRRLTNAAVDPASLSLSRGLQLREGRHDQAVRNLSDALSAANIADGGLAQIGEALVRMQELASQAASGLLSSTQRAALESEYGQLKSQIDHIAATTGFNGTNLIDGSQAIYEGPPIPSPAVATAPVAQTALISNVEWIVFEDHGLFAGLSLSQRVVRVDPADSQATVVSKLNGSPTVAARVQASVDGSGRLAITSHDSGNGISFRVYSTEAASSSSSGIGLSVLGGDGSEFVPTSGGLSIQAGTETGVSSRVNWIIDGARLSDLGLGSSAIPDEATARQAIDDLSAAIDTVSRIRGSVGATASRFQVAISNHRVAATEAASAGSRVRDVDYADVTAELVRERILEQVGTSLLAQANVMQNNVLALLRSL